MDFNQYLTCTDHEVHDRFWIKKPLPSPPSDQTVLPHILS
jgi:hypothetical protein